MKTSVLFVAVTLIFCATAAADTYIRQETHTDGYYRGGSVNPPEDTVTDIWVGEKRMAVSSEGRTFVVDLEKKLVTIVHTAGEFYAQCGLPLDLASLLSEEEAARVKMFARQGTLKKSEENKEFAGRDCTGYERNDWVPFEGDRFSERETKSWVTTDVPFELDSFHEMFMNIVRLQNYGDDLMNEFKKIQGIEMAEDSTRYEEGIAIQTRSRVVEIAEKDPPEGIYAVPEGFTKKEKITVQELSN